MVDNSTDDSAQRILVTGGLSGIGFATAQLLAEKGCFPIVIDIADFTDKHVDQGVHVWPYSVDVSDDAAVEQAIIGIEDEYGYLAGLVNAAGVLGKMQAPEILRMSDWDREFAVDLRGTFITCRAVGSRMAKRGGGAIVNIASVTGMSSAPVHGYAPAKAAVISLTTTLAAEWGPKNVRVNALSPGFTRTEALERGIKVGALNLRLLSESAALQRLVEPREVAKVAAWLLSADASAITGVNVPVDAGFMCGITWQAYGGLRDLY